MSEPARRPLRLLALLQARPSWEASELALELGVTARTVASDIGRLRQLGYRVGPGPGANSYRLATSEVTAPLLLDEGELLATAQALSASAAAQGSADPGPGVRALVKAQDLLPAHLRRKVAPTSSLRRAVAPTGTAHADGDLLTTLRQACAQKARLLVQYRAPDGLRGQRDLAPERVVLYAGDWYLVAWDWVGGAWVSLLVDGVSRPRWERSGPGRSPGLAKTDVPVVLGLSKLGRDCRGTVLVAAGPKEVAALAPENAVVEPVTEDRCRVYLCAPSAQVLALNFGLMDIDFCLDGPEPQPELTLQLSVLAHRFRQSLVPEPGATYGP